MRKSLILPMMMYGRFRSTRAKRDEDGNAIIKRRDAKNKPVYEREKCWVTHSKKNGDKGVYPSVNHIYTRMHGGRQKLTAPAEKLKGEWEQLAHMWTQDVAWHCTEEEKVIVEMTFHFPPDKIRRDTNNIMKLLMDSFTDVLYDDDEYALPRVMDFHRVEEGESPYLELNIYTKAEEDAIIMERMETA